MRLVDSTDFVDELHQKLWRCFNRQFSTAGKIDAVEAARLHDCLWYLIEIKNDASSAALAEIHAASMKAAAKARQLYEITHRAAEAILRGRSADSVIATLKMALEAFGEPAVA
jgi:replicative DNA helicase